MPFSFVHYPGHYGTFIGFAERSDGPVHLCSCAWHAVQSYICARLKTDWMAIFGEDRRFLLSSGRFPVAVAAAVRRLDAELSERSIESLSFLDSICHQCLRTRPSQRWCHEMYGRPFVQDYGWYIEQRRFEIGVFPYSVDYVRCPREIRTLLEIDPNSFIRAHREMLARNAQQAAAFHKRFEAQQRQVTRLVENEVRARFGHELVGSPSSGETIIHGIFRQLYPDEPIHRCSRPRFLDGMEFDIFLPRQRLAIEYQGQQHFHAVEHWGGADALARLQERDRRKQEICYEQGITLIHFHHEDVLTEAFVRERIVNTQSPDQNGGSEPHDRVSVPYRPSLPRGR